MNSFVLAALRAAVVALVVAGCQGSGGRPPAVTPEPVTAPASLSAAALSSSSVYVTWSDASDDETVFLVERAPEVTGAPGTWISVGGLLANVTSFVDQDLTPEATYWYRVSALKGNEPAAPSEAVSVTLPSTEVPTAPPAPTGIAVLATGARELTVSWTDASPNEVVFVVERAPDVGASPGEWSSAGIVLANATSFLDQGLSPATTYWYRVTALREGGLESTSSTAQGTVSEDSVPVPPASPVEVIAEAQSSTSVLVSWLDGGDDAPIFLVEVAPDSGGGEQDYVTSGIALQGASSFLVEWLEPETLYWFRVTARGANGLSGTSDLVVATTLAEDSPAPPAAPVLEAPTAVSPTEVILTWLDASDDEIRFIVERKLEGEEGDWTEVGAALANLDSFTDLSVSPGATYLYRVTAVAASGLSSSSAAARVTTPAEDDPVPPEAPLDVALEALSSSSILVTWTDASDNEVAFVVERARDDAGLPGAWRAAGAVLSDVTTFTDETVDDETTYWYRVKAVAQGSLYATSSEVATSTPEIPAPEPPVAPGSVEGAPGSPTEILVSWLDASDDEALFVISYAVDDGGEPEEEDWEINGYVPTDQTSFLVNSLSPGVTYWFRVTALGANGLSSSSEAATASTPDLPDPDPPGAPLILLVALSGDQAVEITWIDLSGDEVAFSIERATDDGLGGSDWEEVGTTIADAASFVDYSVSPGESYLYRVVALAAPGIGATSDSLSISVPFPEDPVPPGAPTDLSLTVVGQDSILVEWVDASDSELYFAIERSPDVEGEPSESWTVVGTVPAGTQSFISSVEPGFAYWYRVTAYSAEGASASSAVAAIWVEDVGPAWTPEISVVEALGTDSARVTLDADLENLDYFDFESAVDVDGAPGEWTYTYYFFEEPTVAIITSLSPNTQYWLRVKQFNLDESWVVSDPVAVRTGWAEALGGGGEWFSSALGPSGEIYIWGKNDLGVFADGDLQAHRFLPVVLSETSGFLQLASGAGHTLGLMDFSGFVSSWGDNAWGQCGSDVGPVIPFLDLVDGIDSVVAVAAGAAHSLALRSDGTVWTWGANWSGQLGDGTTENRIIPAQVPALSGITFIAAGGSSSLAIDSSGAVYTWGQNDVGQLGIGSTDNQSTPVLVEALTTPASTAAMGTSHTQVVDTSGRVYSCGSSWSGELGRNFWEGSTWLPQIVPYVAHVVAVACGEGFSLALDEDGVVWATGANELGQCGSGTLAEQWEYYPVLNLEKRVTAISAGPTTAYALLEDGTLATWGDNEFGMLGVGEASLFPTPTEVDLSGIDALSVGPSQLVALLDDGSVSISGDSAEGALGNNYATPSLDSPASLEFFPGHGQVVESGNEANFAAERGGVLWSWGNFDTFQLGQNVDVDLEAPGVIPDLTGVVAVSTGETHALALKSNGEVRAWGYNSDGQLGYPLEGSLEPVTVSLPGAASAIAAGAWHSLILLEDGSMVSFGDNLWGQLGDGTSDDHTEPAWVNQPPAPFIAIAAGANHCLAIAFDGSVFAWGSNEYGQLGTGDFFNASEPTYISSLSGIVAIAASSNTSLAIDSSGVVYTWGSGGEGTLGNGDFTPYSPYPTPIDLPPVVTCDGHPLGDSFVCLKADGTAVGWGPSLVGELGVGEVLRFSPVPLLVQPPVDD